MKNLIFCLAFFAVSCNASEKTTDLQQAKKISPTEEVSSSESEESISSLTDVFGFSPIDMETPALIPDLPEFDVYPIKVRIVIEGQPIKFKDEGKDVAAMWWAKDIQNVRKQLKIAEEIYSEVPVVFVITEVTIR